MYKSDYWKFSDGRNCVRNFYYTRSPFYYLTFLLIIPEQYFVEQNTTAKSHNSNSWWGCSSAKSASRAYGFFTHVKLLPLLKWL